MAEWLKIALPSMLTLVGTIITVLLTSNKQTTVLQKEVEHLKEDVCKLEKNVKEDIGRLEKKQDRYNNLQERMAYAESSLKSAHHRIDDMDNKHIA